MSRNKGKVAERQACHYLATLGFPGSARTAQCRGKTNGETDIRCPDLPNIHWEVKCVKGLEVGSSAWEAAIAQARAECKPYCRWAVLWKPYARAWCLTFDGDNGYIVTVTGDATITAALKKLDENPRLSTPTLSGKGVV